MLSQCLNFLTEATTYLVFFSTLKVYEVYLTHTLGNSHFISLSFLQLIQKVVF